MNTEEQLSELMAVAFGVSLHAQVFYDVTNKEKEGKSRSGIIHRATNREQILREQIKALNSELSEITGKPGPRGAKGKDDENPNKRFPGERPSSLISGKQLTPEVLGALLAHFENKIMFQGFTWNVNSFDQEGVQLGKKLTKNVLAGDMDETLAAYAGILGL